MKTIAFFFLPTILLVAAPANLLVADQPKTEEGFISLFDGKTLDGWKKAEEEYK